MKKMVFVGTGSRAYGFFVRMREMLFGGVTDDPLGQCADSFAGVKSVMIGELKLEKIIYRGVKKCIN